MKHNARGTRDAPPPTVRRVAHVGVSSDVSFTMFSFTMERPGDAGLLLMLFFGLFFTISIVSSRFLARRLGYVDGFRRG